jgi:hypothetical protein
MTSVFKSPEGFPDFSSLVRVLSVYLTQPDGTSHRVLGELPFVPTVTNRRGKPDYPPITLKTFRDTYGGLKAKVADPVSGELLDVDLSAFSDIPEESEVVVDFYFLPLNGPIVD